MSLLVHLFFALTSVAHATYVGFFPSQRQLQLSYGLMAGTLISGTYLVVSSGAHMLSACLSGLAYVGFVSVLLAIAQRRLAHQHNNR